MRVATWAIALALATVGCSGMADGEPSDLEGMTPRMDPGGPFEGCALGEFHVEGCEPDDAAWVVAPDAPTWTGVGDESGDRDPPIGVIPGEMDPDEMDPGEPSTEAAVPDPACDASHRASTEEECGEVAAPSSFAPLASTCLLPFPATTTPPCLIEPVGPQRFVDAAIGDDANSGDDPTRPWRTLCHALAHAPDGGTVRVAEGTYTTASVVIDRELMVLGGYDSSFEAWDPDVHPTVFLGVLTLDHADSTWGGFRMIRRTDRAASSIESHHVYGGAFVRNYVEEVHHEPAHHAHSAIEVRQCAGSATRIECNAMYVRSDAPEGTSIYSPHYAFFAVDYQQLEGPSEVIANRICVDWGGAPAQAAPIYGGGCALSGVRGQLRIANNLMDNRNTRAVTSYLSFGNANIGLTGCSIDAEIIHNSLINGGIAGDSSADHPPLHFWVTSNVVTNSSGWSRAFVVPTVLEESRFNHYPMGEHPLNAPPRFTEGDVVYSGAPSLFVDEPEGDFRPMATAIIGSAPNLGAAMSLDGALRPRPSGGWSRGALEP